MLIRWMYFKGCEGVPKGDDMLRDLLDVGVIEIRLGV
jgi:hypothetical protein